MSTRTVPQVTIGELVNVAIKNARVVGFHPGDHATVGEITVGMGFHNIEAVVPLAAGVTVERVAPAQWPPQHRDGWKSEGNGWEWFAVEKPSGRIMLVNEYGDSHDPGWVMENLGPMRLVRRRGWTPATETTPAKADPEQVDERAQLLAGLRKLVDLLESNPALPAPNSVRAQYSYYGDDETQRAEIERDAAILGVDLRSWTVRNDTGDTAISGDLLLGGHVMYTLYARVATPAATQPDEPVEDDQADADPEAPVPAPAAEPSIDDDAFDATVGTVPPAGRLFEGALKSPAEWLTEYPGTQILDWDGWHDKDITEPISHAEFHRRLTQCTITGPAKLPRRAPDADAASLLAQSLADGAS